MGLLPSSVESVYQRGVIRQSEGTQERKLSQRRSCRERVYQDKASGKLVSGQEQKVDMRRTEKDCSYNVAIRSLKTMGSHLGVQTCPDVKKRIIRILLKILTQTCLDSSFPTKYIMPSPP